MALANCLFAFLFYSSISYAITNEEAATSSLWLNAYQYQKSKFSKSYTSDVRSPRFFFSPMGQTDPYAELLAAIEAYSDPKLTYGTQKQAAACVFPARKIILEKLLGRVFTKVNCPDLYEWISAVNADHINIVFAGAYGGNPASALGHTFLRFYNESKELLGAKGQDLLSYSVGFMALPEGHDVRPLYMLKGLTGGYPGFYEIEPHYLKVGLYNNSESRDLWEWPLRLNNEQVNLLLLYLWELTFNAQFKYFFIGENCSYRLITMLDLIDPNLKLKESLPIVVLPAETVRLLQSKNLLQDSPHFRSSIGRRIRLKLEALNQNQRLKFNSGKNDLQHLQQIQDPAVLDVLIDHWTYENYRARTKLNANQKNLMNATFLSMAQQQTPPLIPIADEQIRIQQNLLPVSDSHRPSWYSLGWVAEKTRSSAKLSYRLGNHALWQDDRGYDKVSWIEYLGLDYLPIENKPDQWNMVLLKAYSLDSFFSYEHPISWQFETGASNLCLFCKSVTNHFYLSGGGGLTFAFSYFQLFILAHLKSEMWSHTGLEALLAPGYRSGLQWRHRLANVLIQHEQHWFQTQLQLETSARLTTYFSDTNEVFIEFKHFSQQFARRTDQTEIGFVHFF